MSVDAVGRMRFRVKGANYSLPLHAPGADSPATDLADVVLARVLAGEEVPWSRGAYRRVVLRLRAYLQTIAAQSYEAALHDVAAAARDEARAR